MGADGYQCNHTVRGTWTMTLGIPCKLDRMMAIAPSILRFVRRPPSGHVQKSHT